MENHEIFLQCDKLFSSNLSHSCTVRFGQLEWYNLLYAVIFTSEDMSDEYFLLFEKGKVLKESKSTFLV